MRVGTTCTNEDGLDVGVVMKIIRKSFFHGFGVVDEVKMISSGGVIDELIDLLEGMWRDDINSLERAWRPLRGMMVF